jgi:hypothetical protein
MVGRCIAKRIPERGCGKCIWDKACGSVPCTQAAGLHPSGLHGVWGTFLETAEQGVVLK